MFSLTKTAAAAALATALSFGSAQAYVISSSIVPDPTSANVPFALENFGTSGAAGLVSAAPIVLSTGVAVSFTGGSGIYSGDVGGVTRSPFRDAGGAPTTTNYLNNRSGGTTTLSFASLGPQTAFNLLWGSVDPSPASYNVLTFTFTGSGGSETITGADVVAGLAGVVAGTTNLAVMISGLLAFDTLTVTASQEAFEFAPGVPVPEPASMMLLGAGLLGLAASRMRRRA